jgi:hypothetical protein
MINYLEINLFNLFNNLIKIVRKENKEKYKAINNPILMMSHLMPNIIIMIPPHNSQRS